MSAPFRIQHAGITGFAATITCVHCALHALKSIITPVNWLIVVQMLHWPDSDEVELVQNQGYVASYKQFKLLASTCHTVVL